MSEHKYTDAEIVKALECCINADCLNCPQWSDEWYSGMCNDFLKSVLDLINRKNAEIESLENSVRLQAEMLYEARVEAIKEFAERLHKGIDDFRDRREMVMLPYTESALLIIERKIDNLVAQMT